MKHLFTLLGVLLMTAGFAQKKELKLAQKQFKATNMVAAKETLATHKALLEGAEFKLSTQYYFLVGQIARLDKDYPLSFESLTKAKGNPAIDASIEEELRNLISDVVNTAIELSEAGDFLASSKQLYLAYQIDPVENIDYLYYAASNAVNGNDFNVALTYYLKLKELNYTGVVTKYFVTDIENGEEREVSETEFNIFQKSKDFTNQRQEDTESKFPEIVKNIALIYNELGDKEKAMGAIQDARKESPNDLGLIMTEANIYIQLGEKEMYQKLVIEALAQDPNNATLYFNLGVVNSDLGDTAMAREFYEKAIELNPSMENAYLNLVALILESESVIVEQMNSLGNSRADNLKYDQLKQKREQIYLECVPILKKLIEIDDSNLEAVKTLKNIYGTIGDNEGFSAMNTILDKYPE